MLYQQSLKLLLALLLSTVVCFKVLFRLVFAVADSGVCARDAIASASPPWICLRVCVY